jgi:toxin-antitoxin system PIN domain toxin
MLLPDVNVWLALTFDSHVHHPAAKKWFDALAGQMSLFCRITQQSFLRLATNTKVFGAHAVTMPEAWQNYDLLQSVRAFRSLKNQPI